MSKPRTNPKPKTPVVVEPKPEPVPEPIPTVFQLYELYARFIQCKAEGKVDELLIIMDQIVKLGGVIPETEKSE